LAEVHQPDPDANSANDQSVTVYGYDPNGNRTSVTNGESEVTNYEFDRLNRVIEESQAIDDTKTFVTNYGYDLSGNRDELIDGDTNNLGQRNVWSWTFDALNRPMTETAEGAYENFTAVSREFGYDLVGNLVEKTDRIGRVTLYEYDARNQLRHELWFADEVAADAWRLDSTVNVPLNDIQFEFDNAGRMIGSADQDHSYTYQYDDLNRLRHHEATVEAAATAVFDIGYDMQGNREEASVQVALSAQSLQTAFINDYQFDHLSRLTAIHQGAESGELAASKSVGYSYYLTGQLNEVNRSGLIKSKHTYDGAGRLDNLRHYRPGIDTLQQYDFGYDQANRLSSFSLSTHDPLNESVDQYDYNLRSELTDVQRGGGDNEVYHYDENGNRKDGGFDVTSNLNRLETYDGVYYYHDSEGNRTEKSDGGDTGYTDYEWDHRNRLTEVRIYDEGPWVDGRQPVGHFYYSYDALNQLISRREVVAANATIDTYFVYDQGQIVMQLDGGSGTTSEVDNIYLWGPNVDQLMADDDLDTGQVRWALADHQGTIRDWANSMGDIVEHIEYDGFGNIKSVVDGLTGSPSQVNISHHDLLFAYTGRLVDQGIGLQNNLNRWYDAKVGRWISEDPIGFAAGDSNLYRYVGNSPTNATDPSGLASMSQVKSGALQYSCNCGWIDWSHAKANPRLKSMFDNIAAGKGKRSLLGGGFKVSFGMYQTAPIFGRIGIQRAYYVSDNLTGAQVESVALGIFQDVSMQFEDYQQIMSKPWNNSGFSPEDLPSNLLSFYMTIKGYSKAQVGKLCGVIDDVKTNEKLFRESDWSDSKTWAPRHIPDNVTKKCGCKGGKGAWPKEFGSVTTAPKGDLWRSWKYGHRYQNGTTYGDNSKVDEIIQHNFNPPPF
jgi:RHS repeat-associated protein